MTQGSEEGNLPGLGWFDADTVKFNLEFDLKVPHMGWNYINQNYENNLFLKKDKKYRFYFVHSYHVNVIMKMMYFLLLIRKEFHSGIKRQLNRNAISS